MNTSPVDPRSAASSVPEETAADTSLSSHPDLAESVLSASEAAEAPEASEEATAAAQTSVLPRDAEDAQHALAEVQLLLERHAFAQETARHYAETVRQAAQEPDDEEDAASHDRAHAHGETAHETSAEAGHESSTDTGASESASREKHAAGHPADPGRNSDTGQRDAHHQPIRHHVHSGQHSALAAVGMGPSTGILKSADVRVKAAAGLMGDVATKADSGTRPEAERKGDAAAEGDDVSTPESGSTSETASKVEARPDESPYLAQLRERLAKLHPADIAYVLEALPPEERKLVWDSVKREADGAVLLEVSEPVLEDLIDLMTEDELVSAVKELDADDVADLVEYLPPAVVEKIQRELTPEEREQLRAAMSYPEDSVGGRMDFEFVRVREDVTLEVVLRYLRRFDELPQHTDQVFVVDRNGMLTGSLSIEQVLLNEPDTEVSAVMHRDILSLDVDDDVGDAAQAFERYDLISAPVVDTHHKLIGRLTIDEVVDVIREESETDALNQAGLQEEEDLFGSVWQSARNRWLWLAVNLVTAFLASRVIGLFDETIERIVALATLMPIVAGLAGNSGNQTMALMIRSLAQGQINGGNFGRILRKELTVALLNGMVWGSVAGLATWLLYHDTDAARLLGIAMGVAIVLNLLIGATLGVAVPFTLNRLGRDPALGSSVLLTFSTDGLGFLIFLGLATMLF